jgi:hypothetical protein
MTNEQVRQQDRNRVAMRKRAFEKAIELDFEPSEALEYAERYATGEIVDIWDFESQKVVYLV